MKFSLLIKTVFVILIAYTTTSFAQDVYFAGFTFIGNNDQNNLRYPVATKLVSEKNSDNVSPVDLAIRKEIANLKRKDISIKTDQGKLSSGNSVAMAFALNDESIESVKWEGRNLYIYRVVAQILVFDFYEKKVIANYPVMVQYQDISDTLRNSTEHEAVFRKIYLAEDFKENIINEWMRKLETATIKPSYNEYLQIRSVKLDNGVYENLPESLKKPNLYEIQVAQTFEYMLATNQNVPMLPYSAGQSITGQNAGGKNNNGMLARFSDGSQMVLNLPSPGFVIDLLVRPFKSTSEINNGIKQNAYGAFITLKVEQPDLQKVAIDSKFKYVNYISYSNNSDTQLDDWQAYQTSLRALFSNLTKQISERNKDVLANITQTKDIEKQLSSFQEVLKKCM